MNNKVKITPEEFDSIVPVDDLCMAVGMVCRSQNRALRLYEFKGMDVTVNTARNEWVCHELDAYGRASDMDRAFNLHGEGDLWDTMKKVIKLYEERLKLPVKFTTALLSTPIFKFKLSFHDGADNSKETLSLLLSRMGLSEKVIAKYAYRGFIPDTKKGKEMPVLAFRPDSENVGFMAFSGKVFHRVGDPGMTVYGSRSKDQICMVYENALDFLSMMESVERNGVAPLIKDRFHIILNGKLGLKDACEYLKSNPDFMEVRCYMPGSDHGKSLFDSLNEACRGTAVNRSDMCRGMGSLFGRFHPKVQQNFIEWLKKKTATESETPAIEEPKKAPKASKNVGHSIKAEQPEKSVSNMEKASDKKKRMSL